MYWLLFIAALFFAAWVLNRPAQQSGENNAVQSRADIAAYPNDYDEHPVVQNDPDTHTSNAVLVRVVAAGVVIGFLAVLLLH